MLILSTLFLGGALSNIFLRFQIVPSDNAVDNASVHPISLNFRLLRALVQNILPMLTSFVTNRDDNPLEHGLYPVNNFHARIFFLRLVGLKISNNTNALCRTPTHLFQRNFLPSFFLRFLGPRYILRLTFFKVGFFLRTRLFLLERFLFHLFRLHTRGLHLIFHANDPFLQNRVRPFTTLRVVDVMSINFFLRNEPPCTTGSTNFIIVA